MWAHPGKKLLFMGSEFAQSDEWNESHGLQWHLTQFEEHKQIQRTISELNHHYSSLPALWEKDTSPEGFTWLVGADAASNILAFARWDDRGNPLVCITNFSPMPHESYAMPLPVSGSWREIINTDDTKFGGSGVTNLEIISSHTNGNHVTLRVPPLATLWLQPR
jgi:1,4-alpha-glucan branching enzyme